MSSASDPPPAVAPSTGTADFTEIVRRLAERGRPYSRYQLDGKVAHGGQGTILRVWDEDLRRHLAMKVILGDDAPGTGTGATSLGHSRRLCRFLEEAQVTGQLDHPGIVPVHELGVDDQGHVYFTMKLVKGRDLRAIFELVHEGKEGWTLTRALNVMLKVCEAMAYAHSKGVIHRDLKPSNVMVGKYGEVYVMDWGLARALGRDDEEEQRIRSAMTATGSRPVQPDTDLIDSSGTTQPGDVLGTPAYMSPEQALGLHDEIGPHSDVYSVGAMLYHLLGGHMPYVPTGSRMSDYAIWYLVQKGPPAPLHEQAPNVPAELVAICEKAIERDWRDRYRDTSELAEDLSAYLEHRVVHAYQTGAVAEFRKWVGRNKALAGALAAALVVLVAWLGTSVHLKNLAEDQLANIVRLSALQDLEDLYARADDLWPAHPANIAAYQAWIVDARALVEDLPLHRSRRAHLRAMALPRTEEERQAQRESHPDHPALEMLEGEIACKRRALLQRRDGVPAELPEIDERAYPAEARRLNSLAWERVAPERERFGEEPLGLVLALRAQGLAPENPEIGDTVAWAYFALGRDDDALDASYAAFECAQEDRKEEFGARLGKLEEAVTAVSSEEAVRFVEAEIQALEERRDVLDARVDERSDWRFPEGEPEARWWNNQLTKLIEEVERVEREFLEEDAISLEHGWSVPRRLAFARRLEERYASGGEYSVAWEEALPAISAAYPDLDLTPQLGLVPLGPDPRSGLWEFGHLETGALPERLADGTLRLTEESGLVFVLLPGGTFTMGAQATDPRGPNHDPQAEPNEAPVHEVTLSPFFLSKYEMTQGQWLRFTGGNPSFHPPGPIPGGRGTLLHPVEMISWHDCVRVLSCLGLVLPTEAQWEYGARADTSTPWWTGEDRESLRGAANLADRALRRSGSPLFTPDDWPDLDDGHAVHGPVNVHLPNPFGLHDVHGNLYEWCRDQYGTYDRPVRQGDGERSGRGVHRMYRGGGFNGIAAHARSAHRPGDVPEYSSNALGLRPARFVER